MQRNGTEEKMVSLLERPAPCVFVLIHSFPFHSISFHFIPFHSVPFHFLSGKTERNGAERREGGRQGGRESKKLFLYYLEKRSGMERNGTETGREGKERERK